MPNKTNDTLYELVHSLTSAEKRHFKLFIGRIESNDSAKFFQLFKILDKMKDYNEFDVIEKTSIAKKQLSNVKSHLYRQILVSLRMLNASKDVRIQIREQMDFAAVLYKKGLYNQSLKVLEKTKMLALQNQEKNIAYEIIDLEKNIESHHITRSIDNRADEISIQAKKISCDNVLSSKLSNLSLQLYSLLLKKGYAKNEKEREDILDYFNKGIPKINQTELEFRESMWFLKAHIWKCFLMQDFLNGYRYSRKFIDLFKDNPKMIRNHPVFYLKGQQYLLESLYYTRQFNEFDLELESLEHQIENNVLPVDSNIDLIQFQLLTTSKLHQFFFKGQFSEGVESVTLIENSIENYSGLMDVHHVNVIYYKIGCLFFGAGRFQEAVTYLKKVISFKRQIVGEDLQCFARILNLIAHYEIGLNYDLEAEFKKTYTYLIKMENLQEVQRIFIDSIKKLSDLFPHQFHEEFKRLYNNLKVFEKHPFEKRAFLYLDIMSWLESKISSSPIETIIQDKYQNYLNSDKN